jgi:hypothetical protein
MDPPAHVLNLDDLAEVTAEFLRMASFIRNAQGDLTVSAAATLMRHAQHAMEEARQLADVQRLLDQQQIERPSRWKV